ncbi:type III-B CRISPR-associated protein Cas10/Cmr2 [Methanopyrus sp.]
MPRLVTVRLRPSGGIKAWIRGRKLADSLAASWLLGYLVHRVLERLRKELDIDGEDVLRPNLPDDHPFEKDPGEVEPWEARGCVMPDAVELIVEDDVDADEVAEVARKAVDDVLEDLLRGGSKTPWGVTRGSHEGLYEPLGKWWERVVGDGAPRVELPPGLIGISVAVVDLDDPGDGEAYREAVRRVASLLGTRIELMDARGSEDQPCSVCGEYPIVGDRRLWEERLRDRLPPQVLKRWEGGVERPCAACLLKRYLGTRLIRAWYRAWHPKKEDGISWIPSTAEVAITPVKTEILNRREELTEDGRFRGAAREFLRDALPEQLEELARYLKYANSGRAEVLEETAGELDKGELDPEEALEREEVVRTLRGLTPKAPKLEGELDGVDDPLILGLLCVEGRLWYEHDPTILLEAGGLEDVYTRYYALLKLDGDRMGGLFSRDPDTTRRASRATIEFGLEAMEIVHEHYGALLYCGGDDVFAALPLHTAFDCAFELEETFRERLSEWGKTCSAGLAVVHHVHPLRDAIDLAYRLEKRAKNAGRRRLAVGLYRRNAPERVAVLRWEVDGERPWGLLLELADLVSRRAAYHLPRDWWEGWWEEIDRPEDLLRSLLGYVALRHAGENAEESGIVELVGKIAEVAEEAGPEKDGDPGRELGRALEIVLELRAECPLRGTDG